MNGTQFWMVVRHSTRALRTGGWRWALATSFILAAVGQARADYTETNGVFVNVAIPDGSSSGITSSRVFNFSVTNIQEVDVELNIAGNFNGDLYGFLSHRTGFSVLLNRVGRTASSDLGYGDPGFNVRLSDAAPNGDIHSYRLTLSGDPNAALSSPLTGTWAPDGRNSDPSSVEDLDPRTALLRSFNGLDASGTWTLFLADVSPGGNSTLTSWAVEVRGVPEPGTWALILIGSAILGWKLVRSAKPQQT